MSGCYAIFDMVVWNEMTDGTSENRMNGTLLYCVILVVVHSFCTGELNGRLCNRLLKYSHYTQFIIYMRWQYEYYNNIFYIMLEVLCTPQSLLPHVEQWCTDER